MPTMYGFTGFGCVQPLLVDDFVALYCTQWGFWYKQDQGTAMITLKWGCLKTGLHLVV